MKVNAPAIETETDRGTEIETETEMKMRDRKDLETETYESVIFIETERGTERGRIARIGGKRFRVAVKCIIITKSLVRRAGPALPLINKTLEDIETETEIEIEIETEIETETETETERDVPVSSLRVADPPSSCHAPSSSGTPKSLLTLRRSSSTPTPVLTTVGLWRRSAIGLGSF